MNWDHHHPNCSFVRAELVHLLTSPGASACKLTLQVNQRHLAVRYYLKLTPCLRKSISTPHCQFVLCRKKQTCSLDHSFDPTHSLLHLCAGFSTTETHNNKQAALPKSPSFRTLEKQLDHRCFWKKQTPVREIWDANISTTQLLDIA